MAYLRQFCARSHSPLLLEAILKTSVSRSDDSRFMRLESDNTWRHYFADTESPIDGRYEQLIPIAVSNTLDVRSMAMRVKRGIEVSDGLIVVGYSV
jgi:hypothetical protein